MLTSLSRYKVLFSIGLLSAAIIAFQISLIQILSIVQWHHFAYMVISVALLGFGAAGTVLAFFRQKLMSHIEMVLPGCMIASGVTMALVTEISQWSFLRFDSYLLFTDYSHIGNLLLTYILFFVPFFLGALAIGLIFIRFVGDIGKIYFANLLGSGAGGILALALIQAFFPEQVPPILSTLPIVAGTITVPDKKKILPAGFALIALALSAWKIVDPSPLVLSQYKDLSKALLLPDAETKLEKPSPYGFMQAVSSPALRYAPGLSLTGQQTQQVNMAIFSNSDWFGVVTERSGSDSSMVLDYTSFALPYAAGERKKVLVLSAGTGMDVAHALSRKADKITAVEPNGVIISTLQKELAAQNDSLFYDPAVSVHTLEPRTFLLRDTAHYDLIVLPVVGAFGGVAGLYALHEEFTLTKESFSDMWARLNEKGVISVTSWLDYPPRNPLKVLATMVEVTGKLNITEPQNHIAGIRSWGTITFMLCKSRLTGREISRIRTFCEQMRFDPALLPGLRAEERNQYNQLEDTRVFEYMDQLFSTDRKALYKNYDFNIRPATDNTPYFSQFIRWKSIQRLSEFYGNRSLPFLEIGYLLVLITLVQITIISFLLIVLPLFRLGWKGRNKWNVILYFSGIGTGYMFVEMVFIQRCMLYLGNPVYAASAVITLLLIFSGIGSYTAGYFMKGRRTIVAILFLIVAILLLYSVILTPVLQRTVHFSLPLKVLVMSLLTLPLAFCMGIPFPNGLTRVSKTNAAEIPWAWGINGCVSVVSTVLATVIAVELGFTWVMWVAALAYCLPLIVQVKWR